MDKVTVYYFTVRDPASGSNIRSPRPATIETIKLLGGKALLDIAMEVERSRLDENEFLRGPRVKH